MKAFCGFSAVVAQAMGVMVGATGLASAQEPVSRPDSAGRLVRSFDFDQRLPTPLPIQHWYRGQSAPEQGRERPGFPVWNGASMDHTSPSFEGSGSLRLPTQGGSTSVRLRQGVVPIFASADYLVTAMVRTEGLSHAGAVLEAWQVDDAGRRIDGSLVRSGVIRAAHDWTPIGVEVLGANPDAAFVQIELLLLQPRQLADTAAPPQAFEIWEEDFDGSAWFDSVSVHQLPRVELSTQLPGNVVRSPDRPTLEALVRDLAGERLRVEMSVEDLHGRPVDSYTTTLTTGRLIERWEPELDAFGWYRGVIRLRNAAGEVVGGARCDFLWMDAGSQAYRSGLATAGSGLANFSTDRNRFGLEFTSLPDSLLAVLPDLVRASGVGAVTLPVWSADGTAKDHQDHANAIAPSLERLLTRGIEVTLGFDRIPTPLAAATGLDVADPWSVFQTDPELWRGYAEPYLDRFGQRVRRWQIGRVGDTMPAENASLYLQTIRSELARLVPGPVIIVPSRSDLELPEQILDRRTKLSLHLVGTPDPRALKTLDEQWGTATNPRPERAQGMPDQDAAELGITLSSLPDEPFGLAAGVSDLIKRSVLTLNQFGRRGALSAADRESGRTGSPVTLTLVDPVVYSGFRRTHASPAPELGAWAQLIERLNGREIAGELDLFPGVRCFVLEPRPAESASRAAGLILWQEDASTQITSIVQCLAPGDVSVYDLFGNTHTPPRVPAGPRAALAHQIQLSQDPIYIEGVDIELVRFLSSVRLDPGLVETRNTVHEHDLVLENPWSTPIRGRAFILEPGGYSTPAAEVDRRWTISPRVIEFSIPPHAQARVPLSIEISSGTPAGTKPFVLDLEIVAGQDYGLVRTVRSIELGLADLSMQLYYRVGSQSNPDDLFLEAEVTNRSNRTMNLELASVVPGFPRGKATISGLEPGETVVRTFPIQSGYPPARGAQAAVSLTDADDASGSRLIKVLTIE